MTVRSCQDGDFCSPGPRPESVCDMGLSAVVSNPTLLPHVGQPPLLADALAPVGLLPLLGIGVPVVLVPVAVKEALDGLFALGVVGGVVVAVGVIAVALGEVLCVADQPDLVVDRVGHEAGDVDADARGGAAGAGCCFGGR